VGAIPLACCRDKLCFYNCNNSGTRSSINPLFFQISLMLLPIKSELFSNAV
jgi:hypothetical protein